MKQNKGFIGIGLIIAIVLGVAVVGGGAYYLGKDSNKLKVKNPENILPSNENKELPVVEDKKIIEEKTTVTAGCTSNFPSTIKLISPNGGEIYNAGQKITIKWESCNVTSNSIAFTLFKHDISKPYQQSEIYTISSTLGGSDRYVLEADDGISEFTLPNFTNKDLIVGQRYFIGIAGSGDVTNIGSGYVPGDYSDNLFTINSAKTSVSTTLPSDYIREQQGWPPRILSSSADSYSCIPSKGYGDVPTVVEEKIINGNVYCVKTFSEGTAGSNYATYTYIKKLSNPNNTKATTFTLIYSSCGVWKGDDDLKYNQCIKVQSDFRIKLDYVVDSLMQVN